MGVGQVFMADLKTRKDPVTDVLPCLEVGLEHLTNAHRIGSQLSDVDRRLDGSTQLELVGLDRNDLYEWHLGDELLWPCVVEGVLLAIPSGTLDVEALNIGTLLQSGGDVGRVEELGHDGEHGGLVQWPGLGS